MNFAISHGQLARNVSSSEDPETGLFYDILGFDPRGVNNTTPKVSCFPDLFSQLTWNLQKAAQGEAITSESFHAVFNRLQGLAVTCSNKISQGSDGVNEIGKFISTPYVVEDMIEIVERHGEWREAEAKRILSARPKGCKSADAEDKQTLERVKWRRGQEKVQYWGFSYGTILGMTLSTMHPDRIHRAILDGVADVDDYYSGRKPQFPRTLPLRANIPVGKWKTNLLDTDKIMTRFFNLCFEAGAESCPLFSSDGLTSIESTVLAFLEDLKTNPIPVVASPPYGPDLITYTDIADKIRGALYTPAQFPLIAGYIADLIKGNGTALATSKQSEYRQSCRNQKCHAPFPKAFMMDAGPAIICTDAPDMTNATNLDFKNRWLALKNQSAFLGDFWVEVTSQCANWHVRSKWNFTDIRENIGANTAHPILFTSNTLDPVTPLRNAFKMSEKFNGSVVLVQESEGHCAMQTGSVCLAKHAREYFQTGKLPAKGVVCDGRKNPFLGEPADAQAVDGLLSAGDRERARVLKGFNTGARWGGGFLGI